MKITLSEDAKNKILFFSNNSKDNYVRLGVRGGGCSGYSYFLEFVSSYNQDDIIINDGDINIICDPKSAELLDGTEIYYSSKLLNSGFKFINPNARHDCGCGKSFSI